MRCCRPPERAGNEHPTGRAGVKTEAIHMLFRLISVPFIGSVVGVAR
jgi:hypothetical protein